MAEHDDAKQASGQCACACGALTRVRRACVWRAQRACATPLPQGGATARSNARAQRGVAVCLTSSAASAFVDADQVNSSPLTAVASSQKASPCAHVSLQDWSPPNLGFYTNICNCVDLYQKKSDSKIIQLRYTTRRTSDFRLRTNIKITFWNVLPGEPQISSYTSSNMEFLTREKCNTLPGWPQI